MCYYFAEFLLDRATTGRMKRGRKAMVERCFCPSLVHVKRERALDNIRDAGRLALLLCWRCCSVARTGSKRFAHETRTVRSHFGLIKSRKALTVKSFLLSATVLCGFILSVCSYKEREDWRQLPFGTFQQH